MEAEAVESTNMIDSDKLVRDVFADLTKSISEIEIDLSEIDMTFYTALENQPEKSPVQHN